MKWRRKSEPVDPAAEAIEEHQTKSDRALRRAFDVLRASTKEGIDSAERRIVDAYARADQERRK